MSAIQDSSNDEKVAAAWEAYGQRYRQIPYADLCQMWETLWATCDFSWAGLADAGWERGDEANEAQKLKRWLAPADFPGEGRVHGEGELAWREATLQDYWRWVPLRRSASKPSTTLGRWAGKLLSDAELIKLGALTEIDGSLWHSIHCADFDLDADTKIFDGLRLRIENSAESSLDFYLDESGPDNRLQLTGCKAQHLDSCLRKLLKRESEPSLSVFIKASLSRHHSSMYANLSFGNDASFSLSLFSKNANFFECHFGNNVKFDSAIFDERAVFQKVNFSGEIDFSKTVFGEHTSFGYCTVGGRAGFTSARFGRSAFFGLTKFQSSVNFVTAKFSPGADFQSVSVGHQSRFSSAWFGDGARFINSSFGEDCTFSEAQFGSDIDFENGAFGKGLSFFKAKFGKKAKFTSSTFGASASFSECQFEDIDFQACKFEGNAAFWRTKFAGEADFSSVTISGFAGFSGCTFCDRVFFLASDISGYANFSRVTWPTTFEHLHPVFEGCRFRDVANFKTTDFCAFPIFDGAEFKARFLLSEPVLGETSPDQLFEKILAAARDTVIGDRKIIAAPDYDREQDYKKEFRLADARYGSLAGGLRTLKLAMSAQSDAFREQRFYRYELKSRSRQPSEPVSARIASAIYGTVSDYGASIGRPFVCLSILISLFSLIFWLIGLSLGLVKWSDLGQVAQAMDISWSNSFKPFSAFSVEGMPQGSLGTKLLSYNEWVLLLVKLLATMQSILSIVLGFLFALAVKRRFQIS
ncbi:pentapeptide repeat-containing protein [Sphingomonas sp. LB-2]|uniref:pentapeptide repeat-containing protein n=1 Tax=Sphingomonas caeni TaxID=2984949 RepID=UPI002231B4FE|nr:pentapeptide repeat-containing protein [Sphingomonas caeni]MCW3848096.1 pentapeptide repeat-containing protein [Sphingomonas caeni]